MARVLWIRSRPKGKEVWIDFQDSAGKRRREKIGADTPKFRRLAKEVLAKRCFEVSEKKYFPRRQAKTKTYRELAEKYWELIGSQGCPGSRPPKFLLDRTVVELGTRRADAITAGDLQGFYNRRAGEASPSTANRYLDFIRAVYNRARDWGDFYGDNPAAKVQRKKNNPSRTRFLELKEIEGFLGACDLRIHSAMACAIMTGMRKSEILCLEWRDVDLDRGTLHVHLAKSGQSREIPISGKLGQVFSGMPPKRDGKVFDLPEITFRRLFERARRASKLPFFRFHDLRHTFASHFIMKTGDLTALQKILGHASPTMVLRYAHLAKGHLASEMALFDSAIPALRLFDKPAIGHQGSHQATSAENDGGKKSNVEYA